MEKDDVVVCIEEYDGKKTIVGKIGIIGRSGETYNSPVEYFDNVDGHDLEYDCKCEYGYGWWTANHCLIKLNYLKGSVLREKGIKLQCR
jgi:hypothetical protein